jgi:Carboxypeptidase regulatory-like domain/TonB dependent receptor
MPSSPTKSNSATLRFSVVLAVVLILTSIGMFAQTTVSTGSIVGTVTDPTGALVNGAKIVITNTATGQTLDLSSNSAGAFNSGAVSPGTYRVQVSSRGFSTLSTMTTVQVGNTATVNARMQLGQESTTIEVQATEVQVNTEQATVQGVLSSEQIENLPVNGRNFLDLAQLEPGVQIQDGQNFDPTKAGYSSISFGGRFGRTARINVDGVDVSDETVGTTTQDIPASAIDQFQLSQSSLDLSQDLTSSGAVNVSTKSGTNQYHGEAFGLFRDRSVGGASTPGGGKLPFQRSQYGGSFGGALIKDKLFFFLDGERTKQDSFTPVLFPAPFNALSGGIGVPFRDNELMSKLDYTFGNARLFYRYNYFKNSLPGTFGDGYSVYVNKDITRTHVVGIDFNTGTFTHTVRFSYLKFQNQIGDATLGTSLPFCCTGVTLWGINNPFYAGPNPNAPQSTPQSNHQIKYDGGKTIHNHFLRYGAAYNRIQGGGFASFFGFSPRISWTTDAFAQAFAADSCDPNGIGTASTPATQTPCYPGGAANPLNYPAERLRMGNGLGFSTLAPALGFPAGGLGPDNRMALYLGDNWKIKPNFTLTLGVRYDRDTGRTDSDLPADPTINAAFPGMGNPVRQPNKNFAPQFGFAWDPKSNGKMVIRGGAGLYYENIIYNNVLFDRPLRLKTGAFGQTPYTCSFGTAIPVTVQVTAANPSGTLTPTICTDPTLKNATGNPIGYIPVGKAIPLMVGFWDQYLAGNPLDLQAPNPNYIGNYLGAGLGVPAVALFAPGYKTPVSLQMNIGIQREIRKGMVFSADFLRNVETRSLLGIDVNHDGSVSSFNKGAAQTAIATTLANCGAGPLPASGVVMCPNNPANGKALATPVQLAMSDFANNGLGSAADQGGTGCMVAIGNPCAFGGYNAGQAAAPFLFPVGRSVYNGLQMKLTQNVVNPMRGLRALNFQVAYSLSRFENSGGAVVGGTTADNDQDFVLGAADNNQPNRYFGPSLLDRRHQISFGGYADLPFKFRLGLIGHFYSPLSSGLTVPNTGLGPGEIFRTDFSGDGTVQDPVPGTKFGRFDRGTNAAGLTSVISKYNSSAANNATPAGQVLITNSLMTLTQLQALGGVAPTLPTTVPGSVDFPWLRSFDLNLGWAYKIRERFTIEPTVAFFNVFNFSNFNLPPNTISGLLTGQPGSIGGTDRSGQESFRIGNGTGVYAVGAARQIEWGLKLTF